MLGREFNRNTEKELFFSFPFLIGFFKTQVWGVFLLLPQLLPLSYYWSVQLIIDSGACPVVVCRGTTSFFLVYLSVEL